MSRSARYIKGVKAVQYDLRIFSVCHSFGSATIQNSLSAMTAELSRM